MSRSGSGPRKACATADRCLKTGDAVSFAEDGRLVFGSPKKLKTRLSMCGAWPRGQAPRSGAGFEGYHGKHPTGKIRPDPPAVYAASGGNNHVAVRRTA